MIIIGSLAATHTENQIARKLNTGTPPFGRSWLNMIRRPRAWRIDCGLQIDRVSVYGIFENTAA